MCCDLCCKEFKGWCQSFTRTERALAVLEALLLVVLVTFLIFLILHLLACSTSLPLAPDYELPEKTEDVTDYEYEETESPVVPTKHSTTKKPRSTSRRETTRTTTTTSPPPRQTIEPGLECSWTPSAKTTALTHYYQNSATLTSKVDIYYTKAKLTKQTTRKKVTTTRTKFKRVDTKLEDNVDFIQVDQSDGEDADPLQHKFILSLVKLKPPQGVVFGCILTIINEYWMLTSASCIEAIEEMDSLDSFVIMEQYGTSSKGKIRSIFDLQIHPFYQGTNKSYDLAAIKSESSLVNGKAVELPAALDNAMITVGERFHVLGFGAYRSMAKGPRGRALRKVYVYRLPRTQCGSGASQWAARHLEAGRALPAAGPASRALCAGVLYARGLPCNYCSGAPLLQAAVLVGVMSDNPQCGVACEPQLYVNIAAVRDWIDNVVNAQ